MNAYPGTLIVLEGIDGCGKSTLAKNLADLLCSAGFDVLLTKEPGGSPLGKTTRELTQNHPVAIGPVAEYLLFAADRAQHFEQIIVPALKRGAIVISDRMADSSLVYQGDGRGLDKKMIMAINQWAMQNITPDITLYIQLDIKTAQNRLANRSSFTVFEKEKESFTQRIFDGFEALYANRSDVITINGTQSIEELVKDAYSKLHLCLPAIFKQPTLHP